MNRNGTHLGRPPYTPEQRLDASRIKFLRGLKREVMTKHWHQEYSHFIIPDGRKVRKAKFAYMLAHPEYMHRTDWRVYVNCAFKDCVNPEHLKFSGINEPIPTLSNDSTEDDLIRYVKLIMDSPSSSDLLINDVTKRVKKYWRKHPIDGNHPDVNKRWEFVPDPLPDDPDELRALLAEFGIITDA